MTTIGIAAMWFEKRAKDTPMPGAREMFEIAAISLREQEERSKKPQTNADRIRAMSDEELAKVPAKFGYSCVSPQKECAESDTCEKCLLKWLKQPAKGE